MKTKRFSVEQVVAILKRAVREAPNQRRGVEEFDDGDAQFAHRSGS